MWASPPTVTNGDPVFQYSGYLFGLVQLCNCLAPVDRDAWNAIVQQYFTQEMANDWNANNAYWAELSSPWRRQRSPGVRLLLEGQRPGAGHPLLWGMRRPAGGLFRKQRLENLLPPAHRVRGADFLFPCPEGKTPARPFWKKRLTVESSGGIIEIKAGVYFDLFFVRTDNHYITINEEGKPLSRLSIEIPDRAQTVLNDLYRDMGRAHQRQPAGAVSGGHVPELSAAVPRPNLRQVRALPVGLGQLAVLIEQVLDRTATMETIDLIERTAQVIGRLRRLCHRL